MKDKKAEDPATTEVLPKGAPTRAQFEFKVYKDELGYVKNRRRAHGLPLDDHGSDKPTTLHGVVGLAFSGGGIRSATFNLGVAQALHRWGLFKHFDLMSTVSGGGFVGSGITSLMSQEGQPAPSEFPFAPNPFGGERPTLVHLRNNSNYLAPKGLIDYIRMFAVLVRGIILNFLVLVPFLLVPCMIITLFYGRQLLERLEYDDTTDRTVALMRTTLDRSNAATDDQGIPVAPVVVGEKQPVKPFLELLKNQAFLPPDLIRNDEPVADALRVRNTGFRDVKEPLASGSTNPFSPLIFLPGADLEKVAKRLIDAELLLGPETVEEIWVAVHVLQATPPANKRRLRRGSLDEMREKLKPHLRKRVAAAREKSGRKPLFMPFVTEEALLEAMRIAELVERVACNGGQPADGPACWSFKSSARPLRELGLRGDDKAAAARRAAEQEAVRRWTEATQAFYDQKLFDPEALRHYLAKIGVDRALAYRWPDEAPGHEEIEMAAKRLWADLEGRPKVSRLFVVAEQARKASSSAHKRTKTKEDDSVVEKWKSREPSITARDSLLAKDLGDRGAELLAKLEGAGLLIKDKKNCPAAKDKKQGPAKAEADWAERTKLCEFVEGQLYRLPRFLFDREFFEPSWFVPEERPSFWTLERWFGPPAIRYGQRRIEEDLLEIEVARAELALRPGTVLEVMNQLSYAVEQPSGGGHSLIDARKWEPRMDSEPPGAALPKSLLEALEEERLVRCDADELETCHFASRQSMRAIPGLLYRHHFYNRQWFTSYFAVPKPKRPSWLKELKLDDQQGKAWNILKKSILEWRTDLEGNLDKRVIETVERMRDAVRETEESPAGAGEAELAAPAAVGEAEPVALAAAGEVEAVALADKPVKLRLAEGSDELVRLETELRSLLEAEQDAHVVLYRARWEKAWTEERNKILDAAKEYPVEVGDPRSPAELIAGFEVLLKKAKLAELAREGKQPEKSIHGSVDREIQKEGKSILKRLQAAGHLAKCKYTNPVNKACRFTKGSDFDRAVQWLLDEGQLQADYEAQDTRGARSRVGLVERAYEALIRGYFLAPSWNPRQLHLPFTKFVALSGLVLVLLFPLLTLMSVGVPGRGTRARGALRRGLDRLLGLLARAARFFRRDQSFSWFMVFIAAAALLDLQPYLIYHWHHLDLGADWSMALSAVSIATAVMAGPALSFFKKFGRTIVIAAVSLLGPLLPFMIYLSLLNELIYDERWPTRDGYELQWLAVVLFFLLAALAVHLFLLTLNPNSTSMHNFYKGRLGEAYLLGETARGDIEAGQDRPLSGICPDGSGSPYHLLNVSLNLQASDDPQVRDRNSDFFIFSRFFVGGGKNTGYCRTKLMQRVFPHLTLGGAMAVSAAAAAPNMGAFTLGPLVILLALLNIRLGYWVPNPRNVRKWLRRARPGGFRSWLANLPARMLGLYRFHPGPYLFLRELLSRIDDKGQSVNVSDGGHLENTAIFELLRRRCKVIVAGDAEADAKMNFGGLAVLQRLARIDLSTEIHMDTSELRPEKGKSGRHFAIGEITYPETAWAPRETGYLVYLKSTLTGDESQVVLEYAGRRALFPHESTGDQSFDEAQFEAYRDLGSHSVDSLFEDLGSPGREVVGKSDWLQSAVLELADSQGKATGGTAQEQQEAKR